MRSIPNLARSKSLAKAAIISMPQQAVPRGMGHMEFRRPQLTRKSTFEVKKAGVPDPKIPGEP
jgi:hypothetical protein